MTVDEWQTVWLAVGGIGALGGALAVALGLLVAFKWQLPELRQARNAQVAIGVYDRLRSPRAVKSLQRIYDLQDESVPEGMKEDVRQVVDRLELLGALVAAKAVDADLALRLVRGQPLRCWYKLRKYIEKEREGQKCRGHYARHFEYYAHLSWKHQHDNVPDENEWTHLYGENLVKVLEEDLKVEREVPK